MTQTELDELRTESEEIIRNAQEAYKRREITADDLLAICRRAAVVEV